MSYGIQIDHEIYSSTGYLSRSRWSTYYHLIAEVLQMKPKSILEIGPGNGLVTDILRKIGFSVRTLDLDPGVQPDIVADIADPKLSVLAGQYDLVIAAEVLEHVTFADALAVLRKLKDIAPRVILTLPYTSDHSRLFSWIVKIPGLHRIQFTKKVFFKRAAHEFNGQHYWEIGKKGFELRRVRAAITEAGWHIAREFLNPDNTYHYFFVLRHL